MAAATKSQEHPPIQLHANSYHRASKNIHLTHFLLQDHTWCYLMGLIQLKLYDIYFSQAVYLLC